ncbi:thioredoxin family protein [Aromatoleum petrolei]|uniref:Thioredoxin n=1 Tax=Aromatoleum petrolei TaxID=76116 RepID=A0ABX1MPT9_9RHOO|nr:thioredoxin family protein [Aromatoleum petrolei]NMF88014.1 thioredoxin [Aromatoleum petrolei]QTQ38795.1 Putative thioredoxin [Aromatoleum petrolei]
MGLNAEYSPVAPERKDVDALKDATVLEFGTGWCGFCRGAQPLIAEAFAAHPQVRHLKIEDGPGRPLGRSFKVKLWPTLVFLRDGVEIARVVRPGSAAEITEALRELEKAPAKD